MSRASLLAAFGVSVLGAALVVEGCGGAAEITIAGEDDSGAGDATLDYTAPPDPTPRPDASAPDATIQDAAAPDGAVVDGAHLDAHDSSQPDTSVVDASQPDASVVDASQPDASVVDASQPDTSVVDASQPDTSVVDASHPDTSVPDGAASDAAARDAGPPCPAAPCSGADKCCAVPVTDGGVGVNLACQASCPGNGGSVACDKPADCPASAHICCGTIVVNGGTLPNCQIGSASSVCAATCTTALNFTCSATDTVRLCAAAADCAGDALNTYCCSFAISPVPFCVSAIVSFGATACH
jgi:hypothetical protein